MTSPSVRNCSSCGQERPTEAPYCPKCGAGKSLDSALAWYYRSPGNVHGPFTRYQILKLSEKGAIRSQTAVWDPIFEIWRPAIEWGILRPRFRDIPPSVAPPVDGFAQKASVWGDRYCAQCRRQWSQWATICWWCGWPDPHWMARSPRGSGMLKYLFSGSSY